MNTDYILPSDDWIFGQDGARIFFFNKRTNESVWNPPPGTIDVRTIPLSPPWILAHSKKQNRPYFFNTLTNTSSWTPPDMDLPVERVATRSKVSNFRRQKLTKRMKQVLRQKRRVRLDTTRHYKLVQSHYPDMPFMQRMPTWQHERAEDAVLHTSPDRQPRLSPDRHERVFVDAEPPEPIDTRVQAAAAKAYRDALMQTRGLTYGRRAP
jgi:hypothetical protein